MNKRKYQQQSFNFSVLTPWEIESEQSCINKYCSDFVQPQKNASRIKNFPKIKSKPRAISTCSNVRKRQKTQQPDFDRHTHAENTQKVRNSKHHIMMQKENHYAQKPFHTISQLRTERIEKKKIERPPNVLQQIAVKNFIIEGGQQKNQQKQKYLKKRQSSYVLKQKFAEIRRSVKDFTSQNKQNANLRVIRYDN